MTQSENNLENSKVEFNLSYDSSSSDKIKMHIYANYQVKCLFKNFSIVNLDELISLRETISIQGVGMLIDLVGKFLDFDNLFFLNQSAYSKEIKMSISQTQKTFKELIDANLIARVSSVHRKNQYMLNPFLFYKGKWKKHKETMNLFIHLIEEKENKKNN
jgi:hypothetical protein